MYMVRVRALERRAHTVPPSRTRPVQTTPLRAHPCVAHLLVLLLLLLRCSVAVQGEALEEGRRRQARWRQVMTP
jgi:hypothetical protein